LLYLVKLFYAIDKLDKILKFVFGLAFDIAYGLGKLLVLTAIVGMYFVPESGKDFDSLLKSGIFFYIVGYAFKKGTKNGDNSN
jgi:hypothetical protein